VTTAAPPLSRTYLEQHQGRIPVTTVGPLAPMRERVLQFGEGNFLRAFVEWHLHELSRHGLFQGQIVVVQPIEKGLAGALNAQQCVYTLVRRGLRGGQPVEEADIITAVSRAIDPYTHFEEFLACARNPDLRFIVSNTTEAGIVYEKLPKPEGICPATFPAKAALFFYERFKAFSGSPDKGLIVLPCELIEENGRTLRQHILFHAADWGLEPEFSEWIIRHNHFCDTLVDRIVPGHPADEADALTARFGYADPMLVASELFHLWVIQGDPQVRRELPFTEAGLNVVWTDSLAPYRTLKVRILNGLHTALCLPAYLAGVDTVGDALNDPLIGGFGTVALYDEIIPSMDVPEATAKAYAAEVLERLRNPFIRHQLLTIAMNSVSKFRIRVLPSIMRYHEKKGTVPPALSLSLAALIAFYKGRRESARSSLGSRLGAFYQIIDEPGVLDFFAGRDGFYTTDRERLCRETLGQTAFWGLDLTQVKGLLPEVVRCFEILQDQGVREAMRRIIE
jgi:tagaturonate reductase